MFHRNKHNTDSKCNWVMDSLAKGWTAPGEHFWGFIGNNENEIKRCQTQGITWYFWDMPYYGRWSGLAESLTPTADFYWRAGCNHVHYNHRRDYPSDRFDKWKANIRPTRIGSKILVCPSSETMTRWTTGKDVETWLHDTTTMLRKHTDRPIEVRYKPRRNGTSGPDAALVDFKTQAEDAWCVVTCISLCAVEAQLMGIPTICDPTSFAADISSTSLQDIEKPKRVDTHQWFYNLAYSQFTHAEIESGLAQEILSDT